MNLHLDKDNFEGAIVATAEHFNIPEILLRKIIGLLMLCINYFILQYKI
jgi:hypothetical protein